MHPSTTTPTTTNSTALQQHNLFQSALSRQQSQQQQQQQKQPQNPLHFTVSSHAHLQRSETTTGGNNNKSSSAYHNRPGGRRLSLQPTPSLHPSLSPPSGSRLRRSPSPTSYPVPTVQPKAKTAASTPTKPGGVSGKLGYYKVMMLGSAKVGKTSLIQRFLFDTFCEKYRRTIEEMHRADFPVGSPATLTLDILDTAGSYEFPAMKSLNIASSNAFIIVFSTDDRESFDEMLLLRNQVVQSKGDSIPIVVAANKIDLPDEEQMDVDLSKAEKVVGRWGHGFVQCSAKSGAGVVEVFKELLTQAKVTYRLSPALRKRRQSLPGGGGGGPPPPPPSNSNNSSQQSMHTTTLSGPTPAQLEALRQRHTKRNSCVLS